MAVFVDVHTHRAGQGICVVDKALCSGSGEGENVYWSEGIHPLFSDGEDLIRLHRIEVAAKAGGIVAIGECGLDRNAGTSMERQIQELERQIAVSERYALPLIIHCVRAFPELFVLHKKHRPCQAWIIHGFNSNEIILQELLRHGFYVSAGKKMLDENSNIFKSVSEIPLTRLFLETDDSDSDIGEIYREVSKRYGVSVEELKDKLYENFKKIFRV